VRGEPLVSVVVAAFNAAKYLDATVRSILDQTMSNLELIVVDDGSIDDTAARLEEWRSRDPRVRPVILPTNLGRSCARNIGIDAARGTWVAMADADDLWARHRLALLVGATLEFPSSSVFTDDMIGFSVGDNGRVSLTHRYPCSVTWRLGAAHTVPIKPWFRGRMCHMTPFVRRSYLNDTDIRYPENIASGEDLVFPCSLVFLPGAPPPVRVAQPTYYYRQADSTRTLYTGAARVAIDNAIFEATRNKSFKKLADRVQPGWCWITDRADRVYASTGRGTVVDRSFSHLSYTSSPVQGWRILNQNRAWAALSTLADRHLRPQLIADVERQLAIAG
jgi:glycosyltransferase involved in cell wall biosynthesis